MRDEVNALQWEGHSLFDYVLLVVSDLMMAIRQLAEVILLLKTVLKNEPGCF